MSIMNMIENQKLKNQSLVKHNQQEVPIKSN